MNTATNMEEFNTLLNSTDDGNEVLGALRKLQTLDKPEEVLRETARPDAWWYGWQ